MIIGLTGGIACGKSTVARMLAERGAHLVDADLIAREVVRPGSETLGEIAGRFGKDILLPDGSLDRKKLAAIIFTDRQAKRDLEEIMHPPIRALIRQRMRENERKNPHGLTVADIPLLYESGLDTMFKEIMVVYVPEWLQLERLMARDGLDEEQARLRIAAQMPIEEKKRRAHVVIDNSGTLEQTRQQVEQFWRERGLP